MAKKAATTPKTEKSPRKPRDASKETVRAIAKALRKVNVKMSTNTAGPAMRSNDLTGEVYREYQFAGQVYRIDSPVKLFYAVGGTTHRVLDAEGVVHCVPTVGERGCILRWKPRKLTKAHESLPILNAGVPGV